MKLYQVMKDLCWVGQLGLSLIMPLLLCILACWWAVTRFQLPPWLYIPAVALGLGGGAVTAREFYRMTMRRGEKTKPPVASNRHQ